MCAVFGTRLFCHSADKKGQTQTVDLRSETVSLSADKQTVDLIAKRGKPVEFARAVTGDETLKGDDIQVEKLEVIFTLPR